ncbi:MAG: hypothetical protein AB7K71_21830 [Polyangiaceae bacterium]
MRWAVLLLCTASCSHSPPTAAPASTTTAAPHASAPASDTEAPAPRRVSGPEGAQDGERRYASLKDVDWRNYSFIPGLCTLRDGYSEYREYSELGSPHDTTIWKFVTAAFGDWSATGTQAAVVLVSEEYSPPSGPGSARTRVFVYQLVDGEVRALGDSFEVGVAESAAIYKDRTSLFVDGRCAMYQLEGENWSETTEACPRN